MPHVRIHGSTQCAVEKAPTGSQLLTWFFFFFFFFFKEIQVNLWILKWKVCRNGEFGLRKFNKSRNGQFWLRNLVLPICATGCHTDGWGTEGKGSCGWLPGVVVREPHFVPPVLEPWSDERGEEMICAGTDLRLLPAVCTDEMTRSVVVVSCCV